MMFHRFSVKIHKPFVLLLTMLMMCASMSALSESVDVEELFGTVSSDGYENSYFGIGCETKDWLQLDNDKSNVLAQIARDPHYVDTIGLTGNTLTLMNAITEDLSINIIISVVSVKDYLEYFKRVGLPFAMIGAMPDTKAELENNGLTDVSIRFGNMLSVQGETFPREMLEYKVNGNQIYAEEIWILKGDYLATIMFISTERAKIEEAWSYFYLIP